MIVKKKAHEIGDILRKLREARGLTEIEVAEATGIARTSLVGYETERVMIPLDRAVKLMSYYGYALAFRKKGGKTDARESE